MQYLYDTVFKVLANLQICSIVRGGPEKQLEAHRSNFATKETCEFKRTFH